MQRFTLTCLLLGLAVFSLTNCSTKNEQTTEQKTKPDSAASPAQTVVIPNQSELLKTVIGKPSNDLFRGLNIGDAVAKIKQNEAFEIFEDSTNHVGYTFETENFETIDVLYFLDANKTISNIKVDVYVNSATTAQSLFSQLDNYWSGKFNVDKKSSKVALWKIDNNTILKLEDVSKDKDYGLKIFIGPLNLIKL